MTVRQQFVLWTLIGLFFSTQLSLLSTYYPDRVIPWWDALLGFMPVWYCWAVCTPLIFRVSRRFPLERGRRLARAPIHAGLAIVLALLNLCVSATVRWWTVEECSEPKTWGWFFQWALTVLFHWHMLTYAALVAVERALHFRQEARRREQRAMELEMRLTDARMEALRAQLQPHFLFNTLNSVVELIRERPDDAEEMTLRLSNMLRRTLNLASGQEVALCEELELVREYLSIEQMRFRERLSFSFDCPAETLGVSVPNLILQPLVENAVRHGIAPSAKGGTITISARKSGELLHLSVHNSSAIPASSATPASNGIGLSNTRERLRTLYGDKGEVRLETTPDGGATATIVIPHRETSVHERRAIDARVDRR